MSWIKEMFRVEKPVIALLHLNALPGDPLYKRTDTMKKVVEDARTDLQALQEGGVDGILFSNEFSLPYQDPIDPVGVAAMARVIGELRSEIKVPFGVDCEADTYATIDLAAAVEADFARGLFTGVYAGDDGMTISETAKLLRRKRELGLDDLKLLYFLNNESDMPIVERDIVDVAESTIFTCAPDAFLIMGDYAGQDADSSLISRVRNAVATPVFCGTGCTADNIKEKLAISDGVTVGTYFKTDGKFENHVDPGRVKAFMEKVRAFRTETEE